MEELRKHGVIPDVWPSDFETSTSLKISYKSGVHAHLGNHLTPTQFVILILPPVLTRLAMTSRCDLGFKINLTYNGMLMKVRIRYRRSARIRETESVTAAFARGSLHTLLG
jgi:hypothetical protein